jgi:hypothetical protein
MGTGGNPNPQRLVLRIFRELRGSQFVADHGAGGAHAHEAAVESAQRVRDHGGLQNILNGYLHRGLSKWIESGITVMFNGDLGQGSSE